MDAFLAIVLGSIALALLVFVLLGVFAAPGTGAEQLGWRSDGARSDDEASGDAEDLAQLLEAANSRRRARGEPELTVDGLMADPDVRRRML